MKRYISYALSALLLLSACSDNSDRPDAVTDPAVKEQLHMDLPPKEQAVEVGGTKMLASRNIIANLSASADHTTLITALKTAGLLETLGNSGPFTLFAPTNRAFAHLPAGMVDRLLQPAARKELATLLTGHLVAGSYRVSELKEGQDLSTLEGSTIRLYPEGNSWMVSGVRLRSAEVNCSNGVIYVVDDILPRGQASKQ